MADMASSTPVEPSRAITVRSASQPNEHGISPGTPQPTSDRSHPAAESAATDWSLCIGRTLGAVVVKVAGKVSEAVTLTLEHVLKDLIDGQGNVLVAVELPEAAVFDDGIIALISAMAATDAASAHQLVMTPIAGGLGAQTEAGTSMTNIQVS